MDEKIEQLVRKVLDEIESYSSLDQNFMLHEISHCLEREAECRLYEEYGLLKGGQA